MRKNKLILLISGLLIVLVAAPIVFYTFSFKSQVDQMNPLETGEIIDDIYALKTSFVNAYLIKGDQGYIAIDAGMDKESLTQELKTLGIDPSEVMAVLLTHGDSDHTGGLAAYPQAKVYLSEVEEQMINGQTGRFGFIKNPKLSSYETLKNGHELTFGNLYVRAISIPGHTPGSMAVLVNDKYLFVGDSASLKDGQVGTFNEFFNMDTKTQKNSLDGLKALENAEYLFTGHYGYTNDFKNAFEEWNNK